MTQAFPILSPAQTNREEKIQVYANELVFTGWEDIQIGASLDQAARSFSLTVSGEVAETIAPETAIAIEIGGTRVLTGYVDGLEDSANSREHRLQLIGRSRTGQIVDNSAHPSSFANADINHIARALCAPFEVEILSEIDPTILPAFRVQPGEKVYAAIERASRSKFLLLTDDPWGRLTLTRAGLSGDDGAARPLVYGQNILSRTIKLDWSQRYRTYTIKGQGTSEGDVFHQQTGAVTDPAVRLEKRSLLLIGGAQQPGITAENRAQWEKQTRLGQSITASVVVQGWRDLSGGLWKPNTMASVWDPIQKWFGVQLLITAVVFMRTKQGTTTQLTLKPRQGYEAPEQTKARRARGISPGRVNPFVALNPGPTGLAGAVYGTLIVDTVMRNTTGWLTKEQKEDLE